MKLGVVLSGTAHALLLGWGMVSLSAPTPLQVAQEEAINVDTIPIEEFTRMIEGDREADFTESPAPAQTETPQTVEDAVNLGDTDTDVKSDPQPQPREEPVETARLETAPPVPEPSPIIQPEGDPVPEPVPAPATELTPENEEAVPVTEELPAEEPSVEETAEQFARLPDIVPVPTRRPEPPKPRTAQTSERRSPSEPASNPTRTSENESEESPIDDIAALLNKQEPGSSGARRSDDQASLGGSRTSPEAKLSRSELDGLRAAIEQCWSVPAGLADAADMRATVTMQLSRDGTIEGQPDVVASGGEPGPRRAFAGSVERAVKRCSPYSLPAEKYGTWSEVVVNFSAADMF